MPTLWCYNNFVWAHNWTWTLGIEKSGGLKFVRLSLFEEAKYLLKTNLITSSLENPSNFVFLGWLNGSVNKIFIKCKDLDKEMQNFVEMKNVLSTWQIFLAIKSTSWWLLVRLSVFRWVFLRIKKYLRG